MSIGDPSCVYYNTLYKTKSTQKEDKHAWQRPCAQIGRRVLLAEQERKARLQQVRLDKGNIDASDDDVDASTECTELNK